MSEREGSWWPFIVPAVAAATVVTAVFVVEGGGAKHESLTCPASYRVTAGRPSVPSVHDPVDTNDHIAPVRLPTDALVCRYRGTRRLPATTRLSGSKQLRGRFDSLVNTVAYLPRVTSAKSRCLPELGTPVTYLLGLTYTDGAEWITASNNACLRAPTTNGSYDSSALLAAELRTAYRTGSWPTAAKKSACATTSLGRSGQETKLVPDGVRSADVCKSTDGPQPAQHALLGAHDAGQLADGLNAMPTKPLTSRGCFAWFDTGPDVEYQVVFHYDTGADVTVDVETNKQCSPPIENGSLQSTEQAAALVLVKDALAGH